MRLYQNRVVTVFKKGESFYLVVFYKGSLLKIRMNSLPLAWF
uniref:Uncharacterized protein n=1 Tax=Anguilla anguilla TaxID=7936 RepID=A0A0E9S1G0_ANGAN